MPNPRICGAEGCAGEKLGADVAGNGDGHLQRRGRHITHPAAIQTVGYSGSGDRLHGTEGVLAGSWGTEIQNLKGQESETHSSRWHLFRSNDLRRHFGTHNKHQRRFDCPYSWCGDKIDRAQTDNELERIVKGKKRDYKPVLQLIYIMVM
jgi:hypothetical protein